VGHDVVQLTGHSTALLDHSGPCVAVSLLRELDRERLEVAVLGLSDAHHVARRGGAADEDEDRDVVLGPRVVPGRRELLRDGHQRADRDRAHGGHGAAAGLAPGRVGRHDDDRQREDAVEQLKAHQAG
jgi:hypothetical protein